ncbi:hypothetical protein A0O34_20380 [Chryseobacterium glaciei]|uniref:Cleaved adhesin domain-containing protein n=1 Tax=Chryseobacterium glaciei TaxID=1685010 RepID=A0A172Y0Z8_9FLAO|nr:hypothetical protein [Chryseobacterium glaciei]ANF52725.1 hypothetical protein A0O34_20380 [Chryseobacterium glaciei]
MIKKKAINLGLLLGSITAFSQVGINTANPTGILHINAGSSPEDTNPNDDIVISKSDGNVGIGHTVPTVKLDIKTAGTAGSPVYGFKLSDGNQAENNVLYSDANGVGTWKKLSIFTGQNIVGSFNWAAYTGIGNTNWNEIATLTITPGSHMIYTKIHILNSSNTGFVRTYIGTKNVGTNNSNPQDTPILGSTNFQPLMGRDFEVTQSFVYNNVTNANVTLYFVLQSDINTISRSVYSFNNQATFSGVSLIENYFFSTPVD